MNKDLHIVRERPDGSDDRRVRRTRESLVKAMVKLVCEKRWATIRVHEILDRADVGRSTFYSHYRSKDDLLFRSFEKMLLSLDARLEDGRLAPVAELGEHVRSAGRFHQALARSKMIDRLYHHGVGVYARTIDERLRREEGKACDYLSAGLSGALFAMLERWVDGGMREEPAELDARFHALVWRHSDRKRS